MQVTKQERPNRELSLTIELTDSEYAEFEEKALNKLAKSIKVKGFRPGKAPATLIRQTIGEPMLAQQTVDLLIPHYYTESIKKESIVPVTYPQIEVESLKPLVFKAVIALDPVVKLKNIDKLKIKANDTKLTDKDLDGAIYEFQKYTSTYKDVEREVQKGDRVEIDFAGFDQSGVELEGTTSRNHPLIVGDNTFIPGFEDNLIGLKIGDKKEFKVTFPKDYHKADFQNKEVTFKVEVKRLEEMTLAPVDEELSKKILGRELSEAEFRKELAADMQKHKVKQEQERQQTELFESLGNYADAELSPLLFEEEIDYILHQQKHEVERRGMNYDDYLKAMQDAGRDLRTERKDEAEKRVKIRYIIREIVKEKNLTPSPEEVVAKLSEFGLNAKDHAEGSTEYQQVKDQLTLEKIFALFLEEPKN